MFHGWDNFYLFIGSSAAAFIGMLFIVATLTAGKERSSALRGAKAYMTPTVFHFATVMVVSATAMAPDMRSGTVQAIVGACALAGLVVSAAVAWRLQRSDLSEPPHWSDVWCYGAAPFAVYLGLAANAAALRAAPSWAPYGLGSAALVLLLVGIRNAWDLVTWLAPRRTGEL